MVQAGQKSGRRFPWLIAHRGAMAEAPENVEAAFDLAFSHGADGIELDVQLSADHEPVVIHDDNLRRTAATRGRVSELSLAELQKLDMGNWFSKRYAGSRIMTLAQVFERYAEQGLLMVELKAAPASRPDRTGRDLLAEKVVETVFCHVPEPLRQRVFILSFDKQILAKTHGLAPALCHVLNISGPRSAAENPGLALEDGLWGYCLAFRRVTRKFVDQCHSDGKTVAVYSCNKTGEIQQAVNMGIDVIMTDAPGDVAPYFQQIR